MSSAAIPAGLAVAAMLGTCFAASGPVTAPGTVLLSSFRFKLERFIVPPTGAVGLLVKARINGGPVLRLLLDSGSQYVVLNRRAAMRSGCTGGIDLDLVGAGALSPKTVKRQEATLEIGDLTLPSVAVLVADRTIADGVQGVLPLSIFSGFLIRLDIPGKELALVPYPTLETDRSGSIPILLNNQLLFVKGYVNDIHEGYFLLDTGASYTAISRSLAGQLHISDALAQRVPLQGGVADIDAPLLNGAVRLRVGSKGPVSGPVVAVDLSTASRYHNLEIAGLIGYPALRDSVLTVNYRDAFIKIGPE
jgi:Aspartyl protease